MTRSRAIWTTLKKQPRASRHATGSRFASKGPDHGQSPAFNPEGTPYPGMIRQFDALSISVEPEKSKEMSLMRLPCLRGLRRAPIYGNMNA